MYIFQEIGSDEWAFYETFNSEKIDDDLWSALETWREGDPFKGEELLRKIIAKHPWHIDAIHHLGLIFMETGRHFEASLCAKEAANIGLSAIPPAFSWLTSKLDWGHLSNRPFMRAYHSLGLQYLDEGKMHEAKQVFARLVSVHPNDNLGARMLLMRCFLELAEWDSALQLGSRYPDDISPDIRYSVVIALAEMGETEDAIAALKDAAECSPRVAQELAKTQHRKPKSERPGYFEVGGEEEAYYYWKHYQRFWKKKSKAAELLNHLK